MHSRGYSRDGPASASALVPFSPNFERSHSSSFNPLGPPSHGSHSSAMSVSNPTYHPMQMHPSSSFHSDLGPTIRKHPNPFPSSALTTTDLSTSDIGHVISTQEHSLAQKHTMLKNLAYTVDDLHQFATHATQRYTLHSTIARSSEEYLDTQQTKNIESSTVLAEITTQLDTLKSLLAEVERREPRACTVLIEDQELLSKAKGLLKQLCNTINDPNTLSDESTQAMTMSMSTPASPISSSSSASPSPTTPHVLSLMAYIQAYLPFLNHRALVARSRVLRGLSSFEDLLSAKIPNINAALASTTTELAAQQKQCEKNTSLKQTLASRLSSLQAASSTLSDEVTAQETNKANQDQLLTTIATTADAFSTSLRHSADTAAQVSSITVKQSSLDATHQDATNDLDALTTALSTQTASVDQLATTVNAACSGILNQAQTNSSLGNDAQFYAQAEQCAQLATVTPALATPDSVAAVLPHIAPLTATLFTHIDESTQRLGQNANAMTDHVATFSSFLTSFQALSLDSPAPPPGLDAHNTTMSDVDRNTTANATSTANTNTDATTNALSASPSVLQTLLHLRATLAFSQHTRNTRLTHYTNALSSRLDTIATRTSSQTPDLATTHSRLTALQSNHDAANNLHTMTTTLLQSISTATTTANDHLAALRAKETALGTQLAALQRYKAHRAALLDAQAQEVERNRLAAAARLHQEAQEAEAQRKKEDDAVAAQQAAEDEERQREADAEALVAQLSPRLAKISTPSSAAHAHGLVSPFAARGLKGSLARHNAAPASMRDVDTTDDDGDDGAALPLPTTQQQQQQEQQEQPKALKSIMKRSRTTISFNAVTTFQSPTASAFHPHPSSSSQMDDLDNDSDNPMDNLTLHNTLHNTFYNHQLGLDYASPSPSTSTASASASSTTTLSLSTTTSPFASPAFSLPTITTTANEHATTTATTHDLSDTSMITMYGSGNNDDSTFGSHDYDNSDMTGGFGMNDDDIETPTIPADDHDDDDDHDATNKRRKGAKGGAEKKTKAKKDAPTTTTKATKAVKNAKGKGKGKTAAIEGDDDDDLFDDDHHVDQPPVHHPMTPKQSKGAFVDHDDDDDAALDDDIDIDTKKTHRGKKDATKAKAAVKGKGDRGDKSNGKTRGQDDDDDRDDGNSSSSNSDSLTVYSPYSTPRQTSQSHPATAVMGVNISPKLSPCTLPFTPTALAHAAASHHHPHTPKTSAKAITMMTDDDAIFQSFAMASPTGSHHLFKEPPQHHHHHPFSQTQTDTLSSQHTHTDSTITHLDRQGSTHSQTSVGSHRSTKMDKIDHAVSALLGSVGAQARRRNSIRAPALATTTPTSTSHNLASLGPTPKHGASLLPSSSHALSRTRPASTTTTATPAGPPIHVAASLSPLQSQSQLHSQPAPDHRRAARHSMNDDDDEYDHDKQSKATAASKDKAKGKEAAKAKAKEKKDDAAVKKSRRIAIDSDDGDDAASSQPVKPTKAAAKATKAEKSPAAAKAVKEAKATTTKPSKASSQSSSDLVAPSTKAPKPAKTATKAAEAKSTKAAPTTTKSKVPASKQAIYSDDEDDHTTSKSGSNGTFTQEPVVHDGSSYFGDQDGGYGGYDGHDDDYLSTPITKSSKSKPTIPAAPKPTGGQKSTKLAKQSLDDDSDLVSHHHKRDTSSSVTTTSLKKQHHDDKARHATHAQEVHSKSRLPVTTPTTPSHVRLNVMTPSDDPRTPRSTASTAQQQLQQHSLRPKSYLQTGVAAGASTGLVAMRSMYSQRQQQQQPHHQQQHHHGSLSTSAASSSRKLPLSTASTSILTSTGLSHHGRLPAHSRPQPTMLSSSSKAPASTALPSGAAGLLAKSTAAGAGLGMGMGGGMGAPRNGGLLGAAKHSTAALGLPQRGLSLQSKYTKKP